MPVEAGTRIGAYEVLAMIGKGGMGEVYKARDPRVDRIVAIKVTGAHFGERFAREAKVVASLNHPNICQLYDVGTDYLVMEYVDGPTLAEIISKGALAEEEALKIARQICAALEHAHDTHEKPVIHRDLKPANIKIKADGTVKVLDFGLAKVGRATPSEPALDEDSPTLTMNVSGAGMIVGTPAYMSPEQAKGREVDKRADVWSFGVVLYEMIAGERPFKGPEIGDVLASVIRDEPAWERIPARLRKLLKACLAKDPKDRLRDMGDAWKLIEEPAHAAKKPPLPPTRGLWVWLAAAALCLVAGLVVLLNLRDVPTTTRSVRFQVPLPPQATIGFSERMFRVSPDGRFLAFVATQDGQTRLWIHSFDSLESKTVPGGEGATYPFWAPDSASLGFFAQGKLKKVVLAGGPARILCDVAAPRGGTWNQNGVIVFSPGPTSALYRVPADGGSPAEVTRLAAFSSDGHRFPEFLPDGKHFLYLASSGSVDTAGIYAGSLDGGAPVRILADISSAMYAAASGFAGGGLLLFLRDETLMGIPFDASRLRTTGDAFPVAGQVGLAGHAGYASFAVAGSDLLAFRHASSTSRELVWMDRRGKPMGNAAKPAEIRAWDLSPDEKTVAMSIGDLSKSDIWLLDLTRGAMSRFSFTPGNNDGPVWSPDGRTIVYYSRPTGVAGSDFIRKPAGGAGSEELIFRAGTNGRVGNWSPDGKRLVFTVTREKTGDDLALLSVEGEREATPYLQTQANEAQGRFSPDGRWMAYVSDESGQEQVYVQPVPANGSKWQISTDGGLIPVWRADGKELFYQSPDWRVMAVAVKASRTSFEAGAPQELFSAPGVRIVQPTGDGLRFLVNVPAGGAAAAAPPWTVVLNWQAALKTNPMQSP